MATDTDTTSYNKGKLYEINLNELQADPMQPRKCIDQQGIDELTASIARVGVIQPIVFRIDDQQNKIVVAGERRVSAAQKAGLATIPAIFIAGNYSEIALVENILRQDLTAVEEAEGLQSLMIEQGYTQEQLGGIVGKAQNTLSEILSLNKLPQEIRNECRGDRNISKNTLISIAKKKQVRAMTTAYKAYKTKQQKGKTARQKKDPNAPQNVIPSINKALKNIQLMDTSAWTSDDKATLQVILANLRIEIENCQANLEA